MKANDDLDKILGRIEITDLEEIRIIYERVGKLEIRNIYSEIERQASNKSIDPSDKKGHRLINLISACAASRRLFGRNTWFPEGGTLEELKLIAEGGGENSQSAKRFFEYVLSTARTAIIDYGISV